MGVIWDHNIGKYGVAEENNEWPKISRGSVYIQCTGYKSENRVFCNYNLPCKCWLPFSMLFITAAYAKCQPKILADIHVIFSQTWMNTFAPYHHRISLEQNLTIRSHDVWKEEHFCNCADTSIHLSLTRSAQPSGQLFLYLLNEFNSLWSEFTKGIIALTVGYP